MKDQNSLKATVCALTAFPRHIHSILAQVRIIVLLVKSDTILFFTLPVFSDQIRILELNSILSELKVFQWVPMQEMFKFLLQVLLRFYSPLVLPILPVVHRTLIPASLQVLLRYY